MYNATAASVFVLFKGMVVDVFSTKSSGGLRIMPTCGGHVSH